MCWIETLRNVKYQVADNDIKVYKIVKYADKRSCVSIIHHSKLISLFIAIKFSNDVICTI